MAHPKVSELEVADALVATFRRDGYAGAAISDLAEATGLKSASLYHRFPAKTDMALAALRHANDAFGSLVTQPLDGDAAPAERLAASADGLSRFYEDGQLSCLLAAFASAGAPESVRKAVAASFGRWRDILSSVLREAGVPEPLAAAEDRIAAVQGGLTLARMTGDRNAFARAVERMAALS